MRLAAFTVAASGAPIFQVATANLSPAIERNVDCTNPQRGPLLILSGEQDNFVPRAMTCGAYKRQNRNPGVTAFQEVRERGHSLAIDSGWREVAEAALAFVKQHHPAQVSADLIHRTDR